MATRKIVPRADNEGGIGTALKQWASGWIKALIVTTINALTLAAASVGFTIAGGTTSKTLTMDETVAMSDKAPKASPVFTGDVTLAGKVTNSTLPAFSAFNSSSDDNVTGDGTAYDVLCDTEQFDQNGDYDPATGIFTAPITGRYRFTARVLLSGLTAAHTTHLVVIQTTGRDYSTQHNFASAANPFLNNKTIEISCLAEMNVGHTARIVIYVYGSTKVAGVYGHASIAYTCFCGELVA